MHENTATPRAVKPRRAMRLLAAGCALLLLLAGVLPLYAISFSNHPYYDDYNFSQAVHAVWTETHSLPQALSTAFASARNVRETWQGTYTGTLLSNLQPGVFSESLYWIATFALLTAFLLCFGYFYKTVFRTVLGAGRAETACVVCLALFLTTQLLPGADEAFFWFNGGVGNTFIYSLLALTLALMIRLAGAERGAPWLTAALFLLVTLLGGGSYSGGLFGLLIFVAVCVFAFVYKNRRRFVYAGLTAWFLACFLYSVSAPGNAVRAAMIGAHPSAVAAVLQSLYYGVALIGNYFTLPVFAVGLALAPLLWKLVRESRFAFRHPLAVLFAGVCLFCAQLTPPLYSGVFLGGDRIADTYYYSFVVLFLLYETYLFGFIARYRERLGKPAFAPAPAARRGLLLVSACLFALGVLGFKHSDDTLYGPVNLAGGSAALSIVTGEAAAYDRQMTEREELLNDETRPVVTLAPLTAVPAVFMDDLLSPDAEYDVRPALLRYYGKEAVLVEGGDTP
jgi:hypothetical protein